MKINFLFLKIYLAFFEAEISLVEGVCTPEVLLCPHIHGSGSVRDQIGTLWY